LVAPFFKEFQENVFILKKGEFMQFNINKIRKIVSFVTLATFLFTNVSYGLPYKRTVYNNKTFLRPVLKSDETLIRGYNEGVAESPDRQQASVDRSTPTAQDAESRFAQWDSMLREMESGSSDVSAVISGLTVVNRELNYITVTEENRGAYNALMVRKSQLARDTAGRYLREGGDISDIEQTAFRGMEEYVRAKVLETISEEIGDGQILGRLAAVEGFTDFIDHVMDPENGVPAYIRLDTARSAGRLATAKNFIDEWMDSRNAIPAHIHQGFIRAVFEGRWADLLYAYGFGWRQFGTAGIRNEAVQSSFDAIQELELEEFAQNPHAPILTGPNMINTVTLLQQEAAAVRYIRYLQEHIDDPGLGLDEKFKEDLRNNRITVAYDSRLNGGYFAHLLAAAFLRDGVKVDLFDNPSGVPALAIATGHYDSIFGFLVSASHSESWFNGFKFFVGYLLSQIDKEGKSMIMDQRAEVEYGDMNLDLAVADLTAYDTVFNQYRQNLRWFGQEDPKSGHNYCRAERISFYDYYYPYVLSRSPLAGLPSEVRARVEEEMKRLKVLYTAFFGVGAIPAGNMPGFLREAGYEDVDVVEAQTLNMDGRFPGHVMPDPGVVEGWVANFLDYIKQYAGEDLNNIDLAITVLNEREILGAGDPDIDRAGMVLQLDKGVRGNIKERLTAAVVSYIEKTDRIPEHEKERKIREVTAALQARLDDKLLLTANEAWEFLGFYKLKMLEENNALRKDKLYVILKSHVTTSGLEDIAAYYRARGYHVYVVDTYVGFTEIGKKWRDICNIAAEAWDLYKGTAEPSVEAVQDGLAKLEQAYNVLRENVPFEKRGMSIIDDTIGFLRDFIQSDGEDREKLESAKSNLNLIANVENIMGVEESNGYGELGYYDPESGEVNNMHIADKDGSLAFYEFLEVAAYRKAILGKSAYRMLSDMFREVGHTATNNSFLVHRGLKGADQKVDEIEGIEKTLAVLLQKRLDQGEEVTLFNGRYTLEGITIFRDGKYDTNYSGFPEEGIRFILRTQSGNRASSTYRPSGTGTSNRNYNWILGVKPAADVDIEGYRDVIDGELNQMVEDFFGTEKQETGYVDLPAAEFHGLLTALKEGGNARQLELFSKTAGEEIGFTEIEKRLFGEVRYYTQTMRTQDFKHMSPEERVTEYTAIRDAESRNMAAWRQYLGSSEAKGYPKKLKFSIDGRLAAEIPNHLVRGWQASLVGYLAELVIEQGADVSKITCDDIEILEGVQKVIEAKKVQETAQQQAARDEDKPPIGSLLGLLTTFADLGIKVGDEVTELGIMPHRINLTTDEPYISRGPIDQEFKDAVSSGMLTPTGRKEEGRRVYRVNVAFTKEGLERLPKDIKAELNRGRITPLGFVKIAAYLLERGYLDLSFPTEAVLLLGESKNPTEALTALLALRHSFTEREKISGGLEGLVYREGVDVEESYSLLDETISMVTERKHADVIAKKLRTVLDANGDKVMAARFLQGGYGQDGYGVPEGAAINGSDAFEGNQGYYAKSPAGREIGREAYLTTVNNMRAFFDRRAAKWGKPIRLIVKPGIGGQHTPFQGISQVYEVVDAETGKIVGEYELGKDFEPSMVRILRRYKIDWNQVAIIPSSKSGSTDETMMIFVELLYTLSNHQTTIEGVDGEEFANLVLDTFHKVNFIDGKERSSKDLFKVDTERFGTDNLITLVYNRAIAQGLNVTQDNVREVFGNVLGNMFFETTDRPDQSRLSAFIRNSGLDRELSDDAPGFGAMFDNVGGRWTGDLHMMTFLAYHNLDAAAYWKIRNKGIQMVRQGKHRANSIGNKILDEGITDIALVVPDEFFWFGKSNEQNFNESIWQEGFANLIVIKQSHWDAQKQRYQNNPSRLVINMADITLDADSFNTVELDVSSATGLGKQELANVFGELFTTFYGITQTVGNRLIARAVQKAGYTVDAVDLNDLDNPATKIVQANLYLRQPYVELGKGLLQTKLKGLQEEEQRHPGAIDREMERVKRSARGRDLETNIEGLGVPSKVANAEELADVVRKAYEFAEANGRKFVPFIYLEGEGFYDMRDYLSSLGVEWVLQGTGDQHISYQQVLAQPQKYLPFIISFVPEAPLPGRPAIGFAKGYLDNVSPHMVRDAFAEASYQALTDLRKAQGGLGLFLRMSDLPQELDMLGRAASMVDFISRPQSQEFAYLPQANMQRANTMVSQAMEGNTDTAAYNAVMFTHPRDFVERKAMLRKEMQAAFSEGDETVRRNLIATLLEITDLEQSYAVNYTLQNRDRYGDETVTDEALLEERGRDVSLLRTWEQEEPELAINILKELKHRYECIQLQPGTTREDRSGVGLIAQQAHSVDVLTIEEWLDTWGYLWNDSKLRQLKAQTGKILGNDYGLGTEQLIKLGCDLVMMNPTLALKALAEDGELSGMVDGMVREHLDWPPDRLAQEATSIAGLRARRALRAIFLLTNGKRGRVSFQVNPRNYDDQEAMETQLTNLFEEFSRDAEAMDGELFVFDILSPGEQQGVAGVSHTFFKIDSSSPLVYGSLEEELLDQIRSTGSVRLTAVNSEGVIENVTSNGVDTNGTVAYVTSQEIALYLAQVVGHAKWREKGGKALASIITNMAGRLDKGLRGVAVRRLIDALREHDESDLRIEGLEALDTGKPCLDEAWIRTAAEDVGLRLPSDKAIRRAGVAVIKRSHRIINALNEAFADQGVEPDETGLLLASVRPPDEDGLYHGEMTAGMYSQGYFPDAQVNFEKHVKEVDPKAIDEPLDPAILADLSASCIGDEWRRSYELNANQARILRAILGDRFEEEWGSDGYVIEDFQQIPGAQETLFGNVVDKTPETEEEKDAVGGFIGDYNTLRDQLAEQQAYARIKAVPASDAILSDEAGFRRWVGSQPSNIRVVIITDDQGAYEAVQARYGSLIDNERVYLNMMSSGHYNSLEQFFGREGEPFSAFRLDTPYKIDEHRTAAREAAGNA